jgi:hypothetical protein
MITLRRNASGEKVRHREFTPHRRHYPSIEKRHLSRIVRPVIKEAVPFEAPPRAAPYAFDRHRRMPPRRATVVAKKIMAGGNEKLGNGDGGHDRAHSPLAGTVDSMTRVGPILMSAFNTYRRRNASTWVKKRIAFSSMRKP